MNQDKARRVLHHPDFQRMARSKSRLSWILSVLMFVVYVVFIGYIGIDPKAFGTPVSPGSVTTWGIYLGLFVIVFAVAITGLYVFKANGEYERITRRVIREVADQDDTPHSA